MLDSGRGEDGILRRLRARRRLAGGGLRHPPTRTSQRRSSLLPRPRRRRRRRPRRPAARPPRVGARCGRRPEHPRLPARHGTVLGRVGAAAARHRRRTRGLGNDCEGAFGVGGAEGRRVGPPRAACALDGLPLSGRAAWAAARRDVGRVGRAAGRACRTPPRRADSLGLDDRRRRAPSGRGGRRRRRRR